MLVLVGHAAVVAKMGYSACQQYARLLGYHFADEAEARRPFMKRHVLLFPCACVHQTTHYEAKSL